MQMLIESISFFLIAVVMAWTINAGIDQFGTIPAPVELRNGK